MAAPAKATNVPAAPVAKMVEVPKAAASVMTKPKAAAKPKTAAKPKAKPKTAPKPAGIDIAAAKKAGFTIKNTNDLTIVEGIGPKINDLLNAAGIKTFAQLAKATVPQMRAILDKGGSRFRIANPSTWAQQGALAAANKWTELKTLQDRLSGGVKK
jgi:predicted flap endonuclease-1-like 5' DNA nuclease